MSDALVIREARSTTDYDSFADICRDYVAWMVERHDDVRWFAEDIFGHQSLDVELRDIASKYGPPDGRTMLAIRNDIVIGAGAYRRLTGDICELKRLFVRSNVRGLGLGRRLSNALIAAAASDSYVAMRLDTTRRLTQAIALYESMDFRRIAPYHDYPAHLLPLMVFMERSI